MAIPLRVLSVEDSPDDARLAIFELEEAGFEVSWERAQTSAELKSLLLSKSWQILLSDYSMPQFTAIDVLAIVKERNVNLPVIIISGTIGEETAVQAMLAGAQDYFVKGNLKRLPAAVRRQLNEAETLQQRQKFAQALAESEENRWLDQANALKKETEVRKKIELLLAEAQEANRLKEEFLTVLSHELRTPMNAITGWSWLLVNNECKAEDYPAAFLAIYRNALAQNQLIDELLDLSRVVVGKLDIESQLVNLNEIARSAIKSTELSAKGKGIVLSFLDSVPDAFVMGDAHRLGQVVCNLLANSIKFSQNGGKVDLQIRRVEGSVEVTISDNGIGVNAEFLPFIFDRFRQADGSLTRRHGGLGLGLSIVRDLVHLHGGRVEAKSGGVGKGMSVILNFPSAPVGGSKIEPVAKPEAVAQQKQELAGLRILVVDDQPDSLNLVSFMLKRHGAQVTPAKSGAAALLLLNEMAPDILLSDIEMPEKNGYELIREIRLLEVDTGGRLPAAAITAHAREEDIQRAMGAGFDLHISKPIDSSKLINAVMRLSSRTSALEAQL